MAGSQIAPTDLYQALKAAGIDPVGAAALVSIAQRESGFRPDAFNGNTSTGDQSYGLFQINLLHGGWAPFLEQNLGWPAGSVAGNLLTVNGAVQAVAAIYRHSGLNPWGGYKGAGWNHGTNPQTGVAASGGEVNLQQLESFQGYNASQSNTSLGTGGTPGNNASTTGGPQDPTTYHQYQFLVNDPDIGGYLQQLASGAIDDATFLNLVQSSNWWKTHSGSARSWQQLQASDPASYSQQLNAYSRQIVELALQNGVGLDPGTILKLANQWGAENWSPQDATNAIIGYTKPGNLSGGLAYDQEQVRQAAEAYGIKLDDRTAYQYAIGIGKNQQTVNGITAGFAQQAKQLFPHLGDQLDQGLTLQQIAQPYINTAASTLEVDPNSVDLSNPKWSRALAFHDGKSIRQMTNYEWTQTLMSDPTYGYRFTQGATQAANAMKLNFDKLFGVGATG